MAPRRVNLKQREIRHALDHDGLHFAYRPVLTVGEVADLLRVSVKTIYYWIQQGRFDGCYRKRGKHCLFWRDRVIERIFDGPEWE